MKEWYKQYLAYIHTDEIHHLRFDSGNEVVKELNQIGFVVKTMDKYGQSHLPQAHTAFIAIKPRES